MHHNEFECKARVWLFESGAAWHFATIPQDVSREIRNGFGDRQKAWGSMPVVVRIGDTEWKTSIFRDSKENTYLLPIKKEVRAREGLQAGSEVKIFLQVLT